MYIMCAYNYMNVCMRVCIDACVCAYVHVCLPACVYASMCAYMHVIYAYAYAIVTSGLVLHSLKKFYENKPIVAYCDNIPSKLTSEIKSKNLYKIILACVQ